MEERLFMAIGSTSPCLQVKAMLDELVERTWACTRKEPRTLSLILRSRAQSGAPGSQSRKVAGRNSVCFERQMAYEVSQKK